ncbi:MAG TPA: DNA-binding protein WhiA [Candidatus Limnocylindrales bacterium]
MSSNERDLVAALRAELAAIDPSRPCDREAEALGLGADLVTREAAVARLAIRLGRDAGRERATQPRRGARRIRLTGGAPTAAVFDWAAAPEHCRTAYLRGRFLSRGSLSLASSRTHLEFVVEPAEAPTLARWLADAGLPASWRTRRGRGVVTWKSADTVGTFLRRIGAGASLLELEARQVSRSLRGDLNRILNAESANVQRAVAAAGRQLEAIDLLEADGRLAEQPYVVRVVAEARRETPEATLTELAERLGIHRSAVQRALERIERLALHGDAGGEAGSGSRRG